MGLFARLKGKTIDGYVAEAKELGIVLGHKTIGSWERGTGGDE